MIDKNSQCGIALLTAVLVLALAAIAATSIAANHQLSIRRTENALFGSQAWSYLQGGESWVKVILARDLDDSDIDHTSESWATTLPALPLPGGHISGQITDEQGKININNLVVGNEFDPLTRTRMERLFSLLELDGTLVQAIIDWIDPDVEAIPPDGAEDDYYTRLEQPYLTSNRAMSHISELRLIKGFSQEVYDLVNPYLTALPSTTAININSASDYVIASLSPQLSLDTAQTIADERDEEAFDSLQEFIAHPLLQEKGINTQGLSVQSSYFNLNSDVKIGNSFIKSISTIHRIDKNNINVIARTPGI